MTKKTIRVTSSQPVSVASDLPVSIEIQGNTVVVSVDDLLPEPAPQGLAVKGTDVSEGSNGEHVTSGSKSPVNRPNRCGVLMPRAGTTCARRSGHNGAHMSAKQVQKKQDYNKDRARERYQNDPDYAEKIKEQRRQSSRQSAEEEVAATGG